MKGKLRRGCGGPCNHCGRTSSPCWRKGPSEKPVLCNACGARYLVKRSLEGYMPGQKQAKRSPPGGEEVLADAAKGTAAPGTHHDSRKRKEASSRYLGLENLMVDAISLSASDMDVAMAPVFGAFCKGGRMECSEKEYLESLAHLAASTLATLRRSTSGEGNFGRLRRFRTDQAGGMDTTVVDQS